MCPGSSRVTWARRPPSRRPGPLCTCSWSGSATLKRASGSARSMCFSWATRWHAHAMRTPRTRGAQCTVHARTTHAFLVGPAGGRGREAAGRADGLRRAARALRAARHATAADPQAETRAGAAARGRARGAVQAERARGAEG
eukprot:scaffold47240_cov63-Phaeocystis_antarctica.AAC.5